MIPQLKPYPTYRDSQVPWLGHVPEHWEIFPARAVYKPRLVKNIGMIEETVLSLSYGHIIVKRAEKLHGLIPESFETYQIVDPGNIIVRTTDLQNDHTSLRVGYSELRGIITSAYMCLETTDRLSSEFGYQFLNTYDLLKVIYGYGSGLRQNLDFDEIKQMPVLVPSKSEQSAIVRFLRHADGRIRRYILAKQKLIKLLEEHRQAIILDSVTSGLNTSVHLKPSGSRFIAEIPEDWSVLQIRRLVSTVTSGSRGWAAFYSDEGDIFLQSGNLGRSMSLNLSTIQHVQLPSNAEGIRTRVQRNDLLICITGALTGNVVVVDRDLAEAYVNQHIALVRVRRDAVVPKFLAYCLYSQIGRAQFKTAEYGGTKQGLGLDEVKSAVVPLPPKAEQQQIVKALDAQLTTLNMAVKQALDEMDLVREYRTRLIADVVTGKIDVRNAVANLPDEIEDPEGLPFAEEVLEDGSDSELTSEVLAEEVVS